MHVSRNYYTLIASLPHLPNQFDVDRLPISRSELRGRLRLLQTDDHLVVDQVTQFFVWDRQPLERTEEDVIQIYNRLKRDIRNPLVRQIVDHRIDMRTIVAAIRLRLAGAQPPQGVGQLTDTIRRNWSRPFFSLEPRYPWIEPFTHVLEQGLQRRGQYLLFENLWTTWKRRAQDYHFTFEVVILYLARWEILERWTCQNADEGRLRFNNLLTETLGEYSNLY